MSARFDCADPAQLLQGLAEAEAALRRGELVVMPTDTVYGIAAEAFDPVAVDGLLKAKGRGRDMPPPVLVGSVRAAMALVDGPGRRRERPDRGVLARRADHRLPVQPHAGLGPGRHQGHRGGADAAAPLALDLLKRTGPLAVSSANLSGQPPSTSCDEALAQLGDSVAVYLDGGPCPGDVPSTIVDLTGTVPRLLRQGVIPADRLREVILLTTWKKRSPGTPPGTRPRRGRSRATLGRAGPGGPPGRRRGRTGGAAEAAPGPAPAARPGRCSLTRENRLPRARRRVSMAAMGGCAAYPQVSALKLIPNG